MRYVVAIKDRGCWFYNTSTRTGWRADINEAELHVTEKDAFTQIDLLPDKIQIEGSGEEYTDAVVLPVHTIVDHEPIQRPEHCRSL
jgi:hypothetical protein